MGAMKWTKTTTAVFWLGMIVIMGVTSECGMEPVVDLSDGLGDPPAG